MSDEEQRGFFRDQELLQPEDRCEIEVVGRLVQKQQVGPTGQRPRQQHAAFESARQRREVPSGRQLQALQQLVQMHFPLPFLLVGRRPQSTGHQIMHGTREIIRHLLGEPGEMGARLAENLSAIGPDLAGDQLHQCRLARPVAPDQAHPLPRFDLKTDRVNQRWATEGVGDIE